jgi:RNA polymerase sigma-70 factor (ECF subfamily)
VANAYLAAVRGQDFDRLLALLDPDVLLRADRAVLGSPEPLQLRGAHAVADGAMASAGPARDTEPALIDGTVGLVMVIDGQLTRALAFTYTSDLITGIDVIADPARLQQLAIGVLDPTP